MIQEWETSENNSGPTVPLTAPLSHWGLRPNQFNLIQNITVTFPLRSFEKLISGQMYKASKVK